MEVGSLTLELHIYFEGRQTLVNILNLLFSVKI